MHAGGCCGRQCHHRCWWRVSDHGAKQRPMAANCASLAAPSRTSELVASGGMRRDNRSTERLSPVRRKQNRTSGGQSSGVLACYSSTADETAAQGSGLAPSESCQSSPVHQSKESTIRHPISHFPFYFRSRSPSASRLLLIPPFYLVLVPQAQEPKA